MSAANAARPHRLWWCPPSVLTRPWKPAVLVGTDEYCNPTAALTLPGLGMWTLCYRPGRLNTEPCDNPNTCEH
ncbi:hypothetical protein [Nocardiopsis synnemataformans]|uniref:hypothetical protein n=1 Tax=Nocardiopsis synnemataformans TaxID=61305 RepID=UPI003EBACC9A